MGEGERVCVFFFASCEIKAEEKREGKEGREEEAALGSAVRSGPVSMTPPEH